MVPCPVSTRETRKIKKPGGCVVATFTGWPLASTGQLTLRIFADLTEVYSVVVFLGFRLFQSNSVDTKKARSIRDGTGVVTA